MVPGSPTTSSTPLSSASPAGTRVAAAAVRGSDLRSSRRSPAPTAARPGRPTGPAAAQTCGSSCPQTAVESSEFTEQLSRKEREVQALDGAKHVYARLPG